MSPDGQWVAYTSDESGQEEVYVRPFPNVDDGRSLVSQDGGGKAVWGPDSRELFCQGKDGALIAVTSDADPTFSPGNLDTLFDGPSRLPSSASGSAFDVLPDGQRFLIAREIESAASAQPQLIVVQNWFEELTRLVPVN